MVDVNGLKVLSCVFWNDVLCSFRKSESFGIMERCFTCRHHERFLFAMADQDEKEAYEVDELHELSRVHESGEMSDEEFRKRYFEITNRG